VYEEAWGLENVKKEAGGDFFSHYNSKRFIACPSMSYFQNLPLELREVILDHLDAADFRNTLQAARFLRHSSEKRLYHGVALPTDRNDAEGLERIHTLFLETVVQNDHLALHVVKLVLGDFNPPEEGNPDINRVIGEAMKKMINLKELEIYGNPYIAHARLHSVPFSLTHLVISTQICADEEPVPGLLPILQAHPDLEELALDCSGLSDDLVSTLTAERKGLIPQNEILCPKLKRFDGYDEGLLLFLPRRRIESATSLGSGAGFFDDEGRGGDCRFLNPALIPSFQYLRALEVWPNREQYGPKYSLPTFAPYLTSLTHLEIVDDIRVLGRTGNRGDVLRALRSMKSLESITISSGKFWGLTWMDVYNGIWDVRYFLPDIQEIFIGIEETDWMYHRYVKGKVIQRDTVDQNVACWRYARWLRD